MDERPLVEGYIASFGISLDVFVFCVLDDFFCLKKKKVFWYSWSTLPWYLCYYPHRSRDALSLICGIFFSLHHLEHDPLLNLAPYEGL